MNKPTIDPFWFLIALAAIVVVAASCASWGGVPGTAQSISDFAAALGNQVQAGTLSLQELAAAGVIEQDAADKIGEALTALQKTAEAAKVAADQAKLAAEGKADVNDVVIAGSGAVVTALGAVRAWRGKPTRKP